MKLLTALLLFTLCAGANAQRRHDPLNDREVDQLRETAQEPQRRIDLLISYARDRVVAVDRLRSATKPGLDDPAKMAELLSDIAYLIDELDDNLSMYNGHSEDLRRSLRHVIAAESDFLVKLKALDATATPMQKRRFFAALEDASDSIRTSSESARAMLADQLEKKGEEKHKEKLDRQESRDSQSEPAPSQPPPDYNGAGGVGRPPR